ncbi:MAG: ABC transporter permease [Kiloniellales bacterium]
MAALTRNKALRRTLGLGPSLAIIGGFMLLPMGLVLVYSFLKASPYGGVQPVFSLEAYIQFLFERDLDDSLIFHDAYLVIFARSAILALLAMLLALLVGFPVAYYMAMQSPERRNLLVFLVTIPFWTNLLIRTYCWILILRDTGLINNALLASGLIETPITLLYTDGAILLGLVYTYVPFMVLPIYASLEKLDVRLIEAAHDLYADRLQAMRRIVIPLSLPGIVAGSILVFIPALGTFIQPDLLGGGKRLMIGSLIQLQFASSRNWPFGSAAALILMTVVLLALVFYALGPARRGVESART